MSRLGSFQALDLGLPLIWLGSASSPGNLLGLLLVQRAGVGSQGIDSARATGRRDQPFSLIKDLTLDESNSQASLNQFSARLQAGFLDWTQIADFHLHRCERMLFVQATSKGNSHRRVGKQCDHASVDESHGVVHALVNVQEDRCLTRIAGLDLQSD